MIDLPVFFKAMRDGLLGPTLDHHEVSGCEAVMQVMSGAPLADTAYALATAFHETAHTMQPIKEYGGPRYFFRMYDEDGDRPHIAAQLGNTQSGDGVAYCGRGYVQLTGRANYQKADDALGLGGSLVANPDRAMEPIIAAQILRCGMDEGWYAGDRKGRHKFRRHLPKVGAASLSEFINARRIINGIDDDDEIAAYAVKFQAALAKGGWA